LSFLSSPVSEFLNDLSSSKPTPGGGSASALSGAMGAALLHMVLQITLNKEEDQGRKNELSKEAVEMKSYLGKLSALIDEDASAFDSVMSAFKLPKDNEEQKALRKQAVQDAFKGAAEVPMRTARSCYELAGKSAFVAQQGEAKAISDVGTAAALLRAGFFGAGLNVKINLSSIKDEQFVAEYSKQLREMEEEISYDIEKTNKFVEERMQ